MTDQSNEQSRSVSAGAALMRMIEFKIPLVWLLAGLTAFVLWLINLSWDVRDMTRAMTDLQITVKAGNASWAGLASDHALMKFRQGTTEEDVKQLKAAVAALQARNGGRP